MVAKLQDLGRAGRMNVHKNLRLTAHGLQPSWFIACWKMGTPGGLWPRPLDKCQDGRQVELLRSEGPAGLADRSSRPKTARQPTPAATVELIIALRQR